MKEEKPRSGLVALVGPANAGKSTLLNKVLEEKVAIVSSKPHTTRTKVIGVKTSPQGQIVFLDTPGFADNIRRGELKRYLIDSRRTATDGVDCVALILDAAGFIKDEGLSALPYLINAVEESKVHILVLNKIDKLKPQILLPLIANVSTKIKELGIKTIPEIVPLSAQKGTGVNEFVRTIWQFLPHGMPLYPADITTDQAEEFYLAEIIREKLFERLRQEIPYSVAVTVDKIQEAKKILDIFATIFVERSSQKSIVIGSKGRALKAVGIAAREEFEKIYDIQVNLQLFVKVEEDWSKSVSGLKKVGYIKLS